MAKCRHTYPPRPVHLCETCLEWRSRTHLAIALVALGAAAILSVLTPLLLAIMERIR